MAATTAPVNAKEGEEALGQQQAANSQVGTGASASFELNDLSACQQIQSTQDHTTSAGEKSTAESQGDSQIQSTATQTSFADETPKPVNTRKQNEAIGPASEAPTLKLDPTSGPAVMITLLLPTGARHPFKIDEKYLKKRNVTVEDMNPLNISVYTMKELIWRDWREGKISSPMMIYVMIANSIQTDWEPRPTSPSYIRLIFFGSMLDDKSALKECKFNVESPNVVHMTVKPQEIVEDEDVKTTGKHNRRGSDGERGGFRCCVIL